MEVRECDSGGLRSDIDFWLHDLPDALPREVDMRCDCGQRLAGLLALKHLDVAQRPEFETSGSVADARVHPPPPLDKER
jgi:hypothetical protein